MLWRRGLVASEMAVVVLLEISRLARVSFVLCCFFWCFTFQGRFVEHLECMCWGAFC